MNAARSASAGRTLLTYPPLPAFCPARITLSLDSRKTGWPRARCAPCQLSRSVSSCSCVISAIRSVCDRAAMSMNSRRKSSSLSYKTTATCSLVIDQSALSKQRTTYMTTIYEFMSFSACQDPRALNLHLDTARCWPARGCSTQPQAQSQPETYWIQLHILSRVRYIWSVDLMQRSHRVATNTFKRVSAAATKISSGCSECRVGGYLRQAAEYPQRCLISRHVY